MTVRDLLALLRSRPSGDAEPFQASADERQSLRAQALELAERAQRAGHPIAAYLLEMAALELEHAGR
ncbi:MAG: hypothetical protein ABSC37_11530 [Xanthobacteraceae bacterium]